MQDCYERYRLSDYKDQSDAILHSIIDEINFKVTFHNHTYYEIFLIFSGGIHHEVNGEVLVVPGNSIIFIRPDDRHRYYQKGDLPCGLVRLWISTHIFSTINNFLGGSSGLEKLLEDKLPPTISIAEVDMQAFLERFEAIFSLSPAEEAERIFSLKLILMEILQLFFGYIRKGELSTLPDWMEDLCSKISLKDNFTQGIDRLFELSSTSREHVSRSFKKYLALTPTEYINQLKLNYAANQLANTNRKVVDICFDSGFGNVSYFYKRFSEYYGLTPGKYRASMFTYAGPS